MRANVAAQEHDDVVALEDGRLRVAREAHRVDEHRHPAAEPAGRLEVDRQVVGETPSVPQSGQMVAEVRQAPRDGHDQAARPDDVSLLDVLEREPELVARGEQRPAGRGRQPGGDDLVVDGRHDDLDAVVGDDANAGVDVLLERRRLGDRRPGERDPVEERQERCAEHHPAHPTREHASRDRRCPSEPGKTSAILPSSTAEPVPSDAAFLERRAWADEHGP